MLTIDGSFGEGGGQIIRTSLSLSLVTGKPFRVERVRANRQKPGLQRQHLTAVNAAATVGRAEVSGAGVGAREFTFAPRKVVPGEYNFAIGTAGSATLVLQTLLPPLMIASAPSLLVLEGGTHNVHAPPYNFLETTFLPLINKMGPRVEIKLEHYGFYPPGGGKFNVTIEPAATLKRLDLIERGEMRDGRARALVVKLPPNIAERELTVIGERMMWSAEQLHIETSTNALSPGNVVMIEFESEFLTEMFSRVGERGVRAEVIAEDVVEEVQQYLATNAPVGEHLADQLLIPLALARGGSFTTGKLSLHTTTNIEIIKKFLEVDITVEPLSGGVWKIEVSA